MTSAQERAILRDLAGKVREIAELPEMAVRKRRWFDLNALRPERPLVLCIPEGAWVELLPESVLECEDPLLRRWEWTLRSKIYWWEHLRDDNVIGPWFNIPWELTLGDYGVSIHYRQGENRGSYSWDPPLRDLGRDLDRLRFRQPSVDREKTWRHLNYAGEIFGDLLPARIRGPLWWTVGLTNEAIALVGLEKFMLDMYDQPENVHRLMAWLRDEHLHMLAWCEREGLLTLNNEDDGVGSGGVGYVDDLPGAGRSADGPVRLKDLWGLVESQETVGVSPAMFGEFVFPYQMPLLEKFGLNCYGCCEPLHERIEYLLQIPNLRRVSVSPWCDQEALAERLGGRAVLSRKPNPIMVCASFDEDRIREDIAYTLSVAGRYALEIIMKDTHTVQNDPSRLTRWIRIALEEVDRYMAGPRA